MNIVVALITLNLTVLNQSQPLNLWFWRAIWNSKTSVVKFGRPKLKFDRDWHVFSVAQSLLCFSFSQFRLSPIRISLNQILTSINETLIFQRLKYLPNFCSVLSICWDSIMPMQTSVDRICSSVVFLLFFPWAAKLLCFDTLF